MDLSFSLATYFVLALTVLYIINVLRSRNSPEVKNFPPGPRCWPLIGNLHIINLKKPQNTYIELAKTYGSVFSVQLGMRKAVVLAGYETVNDALVNHAEEFGGRMITPIFEKMDHRFGFTLSNGENWKVMRRFTIKTLRDFGIGKSRIEEKIIEECSYLINHIASFKGKPFDDTMVLNASVANIIVSVLLGHRMECEDPVFLRLLKLNNENVRLLGTPMVMLYNIFPFFGFLPGSHRTIEKNVAKLFAFITNTFMKHMAALDINDQRCYIDAFLVKQKEEEGRSDSYFHIENLTRVIRNLISAGMETTSTTLRWGLLLMIQFQDIQEKVQEEISRVIGSAQPTYNHRTRMPYTNAVIHEIQRFGDIVPLSVPHETTKDVYFKGYFIPKGTYTIPMLSSVLKDEKHFSKPLDFNPNHFLDSDGNFVKNTAFMPFSAGRRACPGENLARMELFIFFTSILQNFTFRQPPGTKPIDLTTDSGFISVPLEHKICAIPRS
ncbi:cytochrome P450 2K4-like [Rhinophrynus dorsalis]